MIMSVLYACVCVYLMLAWCPQRPEENVRSLKTGATDSCATPGSAFKKFLGIASPRHTVTGWV